MVTLVIIIVFIFVWYFSSVKQLTNKIDAIREAEINGKETFIDPVTHKACWTQTGEPVTYTTVLSVGKIPDGCIAGDHVIEGLKTGRIYKNCTYEKYLDHIRQQLITGKCWCYTRETWNDYNKKTFYHIQNKYIYKLEKRPYTQKYYLIKNGQKIEIDFKEYIKLGGNVYDR